MTSTSFSGKADPVVRSISTRDVTEALVEGLRDFQAAPKYGLILGGLTALTGVAIVGALFAAGMPYLAYPIAAGFTLVCPFIAVGLYEISRRLDEDIPISIADIWRTVISRSEVRWMGFAMLFIYIMWMYQVRFLLALFLGESGMMSSLPEFFTVVTTTSEGLLFLLIGNIVGAILATILFSVTVVSLPLVLDRDVDFVTAMVTSVRSVQLNPGPMFLWAAIIVVLLAVSALPLFLGLFVTLPILGHATWRLFRRVVAPATETTDAQQTAS